MSGDDFCFTLAPADEPQETPEPQECKGVFYRGEVSVYRNGKGGVTLVKGVRFLKKMSCPGCSNCGGLTGEIGEFINPYDPGGYTFGLEDIEHGKLYTLAVTNVRRDWESGIVDSWDLEFVEVKQ